MVGSIFDKGAFETFPGETVFEGGGRNPEAGGGLDLATLLALMGDSGGGGGGGDPYAVNPLDQAMFDWNVATDARDFGAAQTQQTWQNDFDTAQANWKQAMDERNYALAVGDQNLARQKQADANYWQGISAGLEQQSINLQNQGQQLDYSAKLAGIAQAREASNQQYQVGMAGAANDAERNAIQDRWNKQQAYIAQMEDTTRRLLGGQQNQTAQFGAETDRAGTMGNLALENNKFIAEMARSPRDLFSLFFLQRGITPDWDTMAAGGTPASGDALVPVNPLTAYRPVTAPASGFNLPASNLPIVSGGGGGAASNSWITNAAKAVGGGGGGGGAAVPTPSFIPYTAPTAPAGPPQLDLRTPAVDINPGGKYGGVPIARLGEGLNLSTVGGADITGKDFDANVKAYYDEARTRPVGPDDVVAKGTQVWVERMAGGGYTTARNLMVGDAPTPDPSAGGALPETIENPTGAPLKVNPNPRSLAMAASYGVRPGPTQMPASRYQAKLEARARARGAGADAETVASYGRAASDYYRKLAALGLPWGGRPELGASPPVRTAGPYTPPPNVISQLDVDYAAGYGPASRGAFTTFSPGAARTATPYDPFVASGPGRPGTTYRPTPMPPARDPRTAALARARAEIAAKMGIRRFALGTTAQQAYMDAGMGSLWQPDSSNAQLAGMELPTRLKMLAEYGVPISPALAASATGNIAPTLNMGAAVTGARQAGVLPSLQTLGRQTKSETENTRGYLEGVAGVPWADLIDWLQKPTANLQKAQLARAA